MGTRTERGDRMERLVRACSSRPLLPLLGAAAAAVLGLLAYDRLPRDVFPDLSVPVFHVIVQAPSMDPEALERTVAVPMEGALAGLPYVRRVRSTSQPGVCVVGVEFEPDTDPVRARALLVERITQVAPSLPPGVEPPLVSSLTGRLNEMFELTLEAEPGTVDLMTLRDLAEADVRHRLMAVPGVAAVDVLGGFLREVQVLLDPDRMAARGVGLESVLHALEGASVEVAAGHVVVGPLEWSVRGLGRPASLDELRETVVAVRGQTPVVLGDVADVREGPAVRRGLAHRLGGEVVACRVVRQPGADTVAVAAGVRAALDELRRSLPRGVRMRVVYDQSELVDRALGGVGRAVLVGGLLVVGVLFALLGALRPALVVAVTIPLSLAAAGLLLATSGVGLDTMTLGGLAVAVGLLVDASIIVVENVVHRARAPGVGFQPFAERVARAVAEVGRPIAYATALVAAVFVPLLALGGIEGRMFRPLAVAVIATVAISLLLALTVVPVLSAAVLRAPAAGTGADAAIVRALRRLYEPVLDGCMRHAAGVRLLTLVVSASALVLALRLGVDWLPRLDEGALLIQTSLPLEASLDEVDRHNHRVEDVLRGFPEVEDVVRRTGRSERTEDPMPHTLSDLLVVLRRDRVRSTEELEAAMREALHAVPGPRLVFTTPLGMRIDEGLGGSPADLSVRIFGPDLDRLEALAARAQALLRRIRGLHDVRAEPVAVLPQLHIRVDRRAAARVGLTPGDILHALHVGLVGRKVAEMWRGARRHDIVVRLQEHRRGDPGAIRALLLETHDGTRVPLAQLADVREGTGPAVIRREAGSRRIAVEASVRGRDLRGAAVEAREVLDAHLERPPGYFVHVGGRVEQQERATRAFLIALAVSVLAVFVLLYLALGSLLEVAVVLLGLPDALVGAVLALWVAGEDWNLSSLVGLCGLFGIAVQNALVLVSQTRTAQAEGKPFAEALREAAVGRVRPKLMTAACSILGLLPLLVLPLPGVELERPLAIVMIGGLVTSTLFTLFALPAFYALVHRLRERGRQSPAEPM
ncbi:MAG: efflux RND transporter permease subunit [Myxococcota bacterium]|nr:efflux RND transporter permease subunit [Myxococcota bacterium]